MAPSSAFLAKNQLASTGPEAVKQVVIPALSKVLDSSLAQDRTLCPVRALRVYLERTKQLRVNKSLLFISLRAGASKDICKSTISGWIKRAIKICYEIADDETLKVAQVKAHDVRALSASLAFKGGISLDDILSSCYWRAQ